VKSRRKIDKQLKTTIAYRSMNYLLYGRGGSVWLPVIFEIFPLSIAKNYPGAIGGDIPHFSAPIPVQLPDTDHSSTKGA
jgi:hypothetical protein